MVGLLTLFVFSGCLATTPEITRCYELREGDVVTQLIIKPNDQPQPSITVHEFMGNKEVAPPLTTLGRIESNAFIYADGTRLEFTDDTLTWPVGSLLGGTVFTGYSCL